MKKLIFKSLTAFVLLLLISVQAEAGTRSIKHSKTTAAISTIKTSDADQAAVLLNRLDAIKAMDKSTLNSAEKKELRMEVRSIKSQLSEMGGGVYLSVGGIIIIILLLILLL